MLGRVFAELSSTFLSVLRLFIRSEFEWVVEESKNLTAKVSPPLYRRQFKKILK